MTSRPKSNPPGYPLPKDHIVTVCSECRRASCWLNKFPCEKYAKAATLQISVGALQKLDLENPRWWFV